MAKNEPKQIRTEYIITAAIKEFTENGYEKTSMDRIAKRAGISKGCIYHHFPNKETLLLKSNERMSEQVFDLMAEAEKSDSPVEGLREYMKNYVMFFRNNPTDLAFLFLSMAKSLGNPELTDYYRKYIDKTSAFFTRMFERALESGEATGKNTEALSISMMSALDGIAAIAAVKTEKETEILLSQMEEVWFGGKSDE